MVRFSCRLLYQSTFICKFMSLGSNSKLFCQWITDWMILWKQAYFICSVQAEEFAWWIAWNLGSEMKTSWSTVRIWASDARIHDTCKKRYMMIEIIKNFTIHMYASIMLKFLADDKSIYRIEAILNRILKSVLLNMAPTKGQLISKANCQAANSSKKRTN